MQKSSIFAIALLLGLLTTAAPNGGGAVAQDSSSLFPGGVRNWNWIALYIFGASKISEQEALQLQIEEDFRQAKEALREGNAAKFYSSRASLRRDIRKPGISARNRRLAKRLLVTLPVKYKEGVAFLRGDGTVAADPDERIRSTLAWDRYSSEGGDNSDAD